MRARVGERHARRVAATSCTRTMARRLGGGERRRGERGGKAIVGRVVARARRGNASATRRSAAGTRSRRGGARARGAPGCPRGACRSRDLDRARSGSASMPAAVAAVGPSAQEGLDLGDDVVVARRRLHRLRRALHVHEDDRGPVGGDERQHGGVEAPGADVVHDVGAARERRGRDRRLGGVDRDRPRRSRRGAPRSPGRYGRIPRRRRSDAAPGRDDSPPTSIRSAPSARSCRACASAAAGPSMPTAVVERVRRDVQDAHDRGAPRQAAAARRHGRRRLRRRRHPRSDRCHHRRRG